MNPGLSANSESQKGSSMHPPTQPARPTTELVINRTVRQGTRQRPLLDLCAHSLTSERLSVRLLTPRPLLDLRSASLASESQSRSIYPPTLPSAPHYLASRPPLLHDLTSSSVDSKL